MATSNQLPTWNQIVDNALGELKTTRNGLSNARDWMSSDWAEGHGPADHDKRAEAARLLAEAKGLIDRAKNALYDSTVGR